MGLSHNMSKLNSGIILKGVGGAYDVFCGDRAYVCTARGIFRKNGITPLPGDNVEFQIDETQESAGNIVEIKDRETFLHRPLVANVQQLLVVFTLNIPPPDFFLIDKMLLNAYMNKLNVIICVNKCDLSFDESLLDEITGFEQAGYKIIHTSIRDREGYDELFAAMVDKTTVFAGQSGVGKSTILNALIDREYMKTGKMSQRIKRGKHTTRHVELVALVNKGYNDCGRMDKGNDQRSVGYIVDSPGFSNFDVGMADYRTLDRGYPEFLPYINKCKFKECSHIHEPFCEVRNALDGGLLHEGRYNRYVQLYGQFKETYENRFKKQ